MNVSQEDSSKSTPAYLSLVSSHNFDFRLSRTFQRVLVNMTSITNNPNREESNCEAAPQAWA